MSTPMISPPTTVVDGSANAFRLVVKVRRNRVRVQDVACISDDGCGQTCQLSACASQL